MDGLRGDIVMYKTASTIAAYEGHEQVTADDVREAAEMALLHRQRRQPFQQPHLATEQLDSMIDEYQNRPQNREPQDQDSSQFEDQEDGDPDSSEPEEQQQSEPEGNSGPQDQYFEVGNTFSVRSLEVKPPDQRARLTGGRRARTVSGSPSGRYVSADVPRGKVSDLALDATLRTAAPHQVQRRANQSEEMGPESSPVFLIKPWDVREKVRETKTGSMILFVVDASGSMGAQRRMVAVKGAILSLLLDAYQRRDRVGLIAFRGTGSAGPAAANIQRRLGPCPAQRDANRRPHSPEPWPSASDGGHRDGKAEGPERAAAAGGALRRAGQRGDGQRRITGRFRPAAGGRNGRGRSQGRCRGHQGEADTLGSHRYRDGFPAAGLG